MLVFQPCKQCLKSLLRAPEGTAVGLRQVWYLNHGNCNPEC